MSFIIRHTLELILIALVVPIQFFAARRLLQQYPQVRALRTIVWTVFFALIALVLFGLALDSTSVQRLVPSWVYSWGRGTSLAWMIYCAGCGVVFGIEQLFFRKVHSPQRRMLLKAAYAAPAAILGYGTFIEREKFQLREVDIPLPGLPKSLHGLRIVQITDIHYGPYLAERQLAHVIGMANETKAHLAVMTGDLITKVGDPIDDCLRLLATVKADAGMIGCLGNHEIYAEAEDYVEQHAARLGIDFLRNRSKKLVFDGHPLHFAGVDYQSKSRGPYLKNGENLVVPGELNILLSHNPDVFRISPQRGFPLTISGHTHGGQIAVEYLNPRFNVASFVTPWVAGYYHERQSSLYVSRGIGTIGVPVRIGVPPEVTLIRLCAI